MTAFDRLLQRRRVDQASRFVERGAKVLDLGCAEGAFFSRRRDCAPGSMGIDPVLAADRLTKNGFLLKSGTFPQDMPPDAGGFDAVVMTAVLEHVPTEHLPAFSEAAARYLRPDGLLILTVPSPRVDKILAALKRVRLADGLSLEQHHKFVTAATVRIFSPPRFAFLRHQRFQFGFNNLFVFRRGKGFFA